VLKKWNDLIIYSVTLCGSVRIYHKGTLRVTLIPTVVGITKVS
jgi:hypothetical protein